MKRKKKNKLWMLQAVLCAVCILSAALIYHDYVAIPRQNRELVEELKTCFPEDIPPGGALQERKRNRLEENRECLPLTFDPSSASIRVFGAGLRSRRLGAIIRSCRAAGKIRSIICGGITGKLRHQWKFVPPGRLYFGRIKESDYLRSQHEQRGDVRESGQVRLL